MKIFIQKVNKASIDILIDNTTTTKVINKGVMVVLNLNKTNTIKEVK
jgi:D-Tyr-tRNAtyr deacylase